MIGHKEAGGLAVLSNAKLTLKHDRGTVRVSGTVEAHPDSIVGTHHSQTLDVSGGFSDLDPLDSTICLKLKAGNITLEGTLTVKGLTAEQILLLSGGRMPAACVGSKRRGPAPGAWGGDD